MEKFQTAKASAKVGNNIKRFRKEQGLTQDDLAQKSSVERSYIGRLERGERLKVLERLSAVAKSLGLPLWKLFK